MSKVITTQLTAAASHRARASWIRTDQVVLLICLVLGFLHGLLYVFLIPPWQHYDEPNHFEYAWLVANQEKLPQPGDRDPVLERRLVESMLAHDFYRNIPSPDLNPQADVRLGLYSQVEERPLYYLLVSGVIRLFSESSLEDQLYAGRIVSLFFYLLSILAAWGLVRELTGRESLLRWGVPLTLAFLPGFVDTMTALNNDAAATGLFSLFLWGAVRLVRSSTCGASFWIDLFWTAGAAALAAYTKSTALFALPLFALAVLFAFFRGRLRPLAWGYLAISLLALPLIILGKGDAHLWYRSTLQDSDTRTAVTNAPVGDYALRLEIGAETSPGWMPALFQPLPPEFVHQVRGKVVTFGVWMWADQPVQVRSPALWIDNFSTGSVIDLNSAPRFYSWNAQVPADAQRMWVSLLPAKVEPAGSHIYLDGFVLAEGDRPEDVFPIFTDADGERGEWGNRPFTNYMRNPSTESEGWRFSPWFEKIGAQILPDHSHPSAVLATLFDPAGSGWLYRLTAIHLGRTFWAQFGWGHVSLPGHTPYRWLGLVTLASLFGSGLWLIRNWKSLPWSALGFLGLTTVLVWGAALVRGAIYLGLPRLLWSSARYASPAILPTVLILSAGILFGLGWLPFLRRRPAWQLMVYSLFFIGLDGISVYTILSFYGKG